MVCEYCHGEGYHFTQCPNFVPPKSAHYCSICNYGILDGEEYIVLLPTEEDDEDGEVVILKVEDTDSEDEESYVSVDDQDTLNTVFEMFKEKFKDEFNFIDEE